MTIFICYKKCSTCKKVEERLKSLNIDYEYREIDKDHPKEEELRSWHKSSGLPLKKFFNTSGKIYRELGLKDTLKDMSEEDQYQLLGTNGMLVKRPILLHENKVYVGPDVKKYLDTLE